MSSGFGAAVNNENQHVSCAEKHKKNTGNREETGTYMFRKNGLSLNKNTTVFVGHVLDLICSFF